MIEVVDANTRLTLMEVKETRGQAALAVGSKIKLFDCDCYIIKRLLISQEDPTRLRVLVEKEIKEVPD